MLVLDLLYYFVNFNLVELSTIILSFFEECSFNYDFVEKHINYNDILMLNNNYYLTSIWSNANFCLVNFILTLIVFFVLRRLFNIK